MSLNNGLNMLYSDNFVMQRGGVEYLHSLAKVNKDDLEKVRQMFEVFRVFVKEIHVDEEKKRVRLMDRLRLPDLVIKEEILYKITPPGESVYSKINSRINLQGAQLYGADLPGDKVCLKEVYLQGANLSETSLSRANLNGANLSGANLNGADLAKAYLSEANLNGANLSETSLSRANLNGANLSGAYLAKANLFSVDLRGADIQSARNIEQATWTNARLNYAFVDSKDKDKLTQEIGAKGAEDIIWTNNPSDNHLSWRDVHDSSKIIDSLKQELEKETDDEMRGVISHVIDRLS